MVVAETSDVVIVNTGDTLVPAATVTEAGTVTPGPPLDRFTTVSTGAGPLSVTLFAEVETPPMTDVGERATVTTFSGLRVRVAAAFAPLYVAETVTAVVVKTPLVVTTNVAPETPAPMGTVAGTETALLLLDRLTKIPPGGA